MQKIWNPIQDIHKGDWQEKGEGELKDNSWKAGLGNNQSRTKLENGSLQEGYCQEVNVNDRVADIFQCIF